MNETKLSKHEYKTLTPDFSEGIRSSAFENWLENNNEKYILTERDILNIEGAAKRLAWVFIFFAIIIPLTLFLFGGDFDYWLKLENSFSPKNIEKSFVRVLSIIFPIVLLFCAWYSVKTTSNDIDAVRKRKYSAYILDVKEKLYYRNSLWLKDKNEPFEYYYIRCGEITIKLKNASKKLYNRIHGKVLVVKFYHNYALFGFRQSKGNRICFYPVAEQLFHVKHTKGEHNGYYQNSGTV